jgi:hypothetical protein
LKSEFSLFNVNTNQITSIPLEVSTHDCGDKLKNCSNIKEFAQSVKNFTSGISGSDSNKNENLQQKFDTDSKYENLISDVDQNIPANSILNDKTFAVIVGNESYVREIKAKYAVNDAKVFKQYLNITFGVPKENIRYVENGTYGEMLESLKWLNNVIKAYNGNAKVIFFYAGHGMPESKSGSAYLLPIDGSSQNFETSLKLDDIYRKLMEHPAASVTVFLDACFSGSARDLDSMLAEGRGVKIKPKSVELLGNMVVFSATTNDETAYPFLEKKHGMFTYFLLKKFKETKGDVTLKELSSYVTESVTKKSLLNNDKVQTPQINYGPDVINVWQSLKFK